MVFGCASGLPKDHVPECQCFTVAWTLSHSGQATIQSAKLLALHNEVRSCAQLVNARILESSATNGLLRCEPGTSKVVKMTPADAAVRLGQLLCRWASDQDPFLGLRVGVHPGRAESIAIPGSKQVGYFGPSVSTARRLAETSPKDRCVHLLAATKDELCLFERLPFSVWWNTGCAPATEAYYLDPWTEVLHEGGRRASIMDATRSTTSRPSTFVPARTSAAGGTKKVPSGGTMTDREFTRWLGSYGIDLQRFGTGQAKTLTELMTEVQDERKSRLVDRAGVLERHLVIVRMSLCAKDESGVERILTKVPRGREKVQLRNQRLAQVVPEGRTWQEVLEDCFVDKFMMEPGTRKDLISVVTECVKEERLVSPSVPGIPTIYIVHEAKMEVIDPKREELANLGLPSMENFTTLDRSGKKTQWCWTPYSEERDHADDLARLLQDHNISIHEFEPGAFEDLVDEVYVSKNSSLAVKKGTLLRNCQIVKVWLSTDIVNIPHVLMTVSKVLRGRCSADKTLRPISMRIRIGQPWQDAVTLLLTDRLGLDCAFQKENIILDQCTYRLSEEIELSRSYPGLKTVYRIHEVTCRILATHPALGLPEGNDFAFSRVKKAKDSGIEDVVTTRFQWMPLSDVISKRESCQKDLVDYLVEAKKGQAGPDVKRRVPTPPTPQMPPDGEAKSVIEYLMEGKKTNWDRAWSAAQRIRDADYTCRDFYEDCSTAFPELSLYMAAFGDAGVSSGRSADDEYQRTVGALFAVYWLMRLDLDGARAFAFGVGEDWKTLSVTSSRPRRDQAEVKKRVVFLESANWSLFDDVMVAAGMLDAIDGKGRVSGGGRRGHNIERTLAMLVLTAIHDIMKLQALLPTVAEKHAPFCGYQAGEVIGDHDLALAYVLEHRPTLLPSFAGLPEAQQRSVRFTQSGMEYNMGWLVQAEAPPGALFRKFKSIIAAGEVKPSDVSFYFVHWLTDLAGAEPYPQEGCEKYVLKFPLKVLKAFLSSFSVVQELSSKTETEVYEDYLQWRWTTNQPSLGEVPSGAGSVARLRLVVMAQGHSESVLDSFSRLQPWDREVLSTELARTGCSDQTFVCDPGAFAGPAFLVYYAPALLQKNCAVDPLGAMAVLAEVLRRARELWPLQEDSVGETVTLRIDALKELEVEAIQEATFGQCWIIDKTSGVDAVVRKVNFLGADGDHKAFTPDSQRILRFGEDMNVDEGTLAIELNRTSYHRVSG